MLDNFGRDLLILFAIISLAIMFFNIFIDIAVAIAGHLFAYIIFAICHIIGYSWGLLTHPIRTIHEIKTDTKTLFLLPVRFFTHSR